ncbi:MAG TPA: Fic family protein [Povalibacter sp.]|uniref:Fic family protein n=1 Tax=Povalibacter sp. TaxID=1962978 RepID=UPI002C337CB6|nr:Fic family protein [Povalibacter sp.]HMN44153.1 Fic family protein [Povalibacter sp.]
MDSLCESGYFMEKTVIVMEKRAGAQRVGYHRLVERFGLAALPLATAAVIDSAVRGRDRIRQGEQDLQRFQPTYRPDDTPQADLLFALRYEGINLQVLALLFARRGAQDIQPLLDASPQSAYARRLGYLYEWLTGESIPFATPARSSYIRLVDDKLQFGRARGARDSKFRIVDNLPGNREFCPLVRKTPRLQAMIEKDLARLTHETLARYDHALLQRAAGFLYLMETQSSFEVEREKPSVQKAQRFAELLREAETGASLSEDRFVELQNAVVDPRFREASWRTQQNWIGDDLGYRKRVAFVPPRPDDARSLMEGLVAMSESLRATPGDLDPVVAAASLAFGFVFIHPFMDGNGRLHRYLIHEVLSSSGFTPKGIVLPVSAVIFANLEAYVATLENFSKAVNARTDWNPDTPQIPTSGNDALYFRYFDATVQTEFLCWALERTIEHDLVQEIAFLLGFDRARRALDAQLDWPPHSLDLFIRVVRQNDFTLSTNKRDAHFAWMTDEEVRMSERTVRESFAAGVGGG